MHDFPLARQYPQISVPLAFGPCANIPAHLTMTHMLESRYLEKTLRAAYAGYPLVAVGERERITVDTYGKFRFV